MYLFYNTQEWELLGYMVVLLIFLVFWEVFIQFFTMAASIYFHTNMYKNSLFFISSPIFLFVFFLIMAILTIVRWNFIVVLICISLIISNADLIFICLMVIYLHFLFEKLSAFSLGVCEILCVLLKRGVSVSYITVGSQKSSRVGVIPGARSLDQRAQCGICTPLTPWEEPLKLQLFSHFGVTYLGYF